MNTFKAAMEPMAAISTAHLTTLTRNKLSLEDDQIDVVAYGNEYGGFVYVGAPENVSVYEDLNTVLVAARAAGCMWVKFDADACEIEGLPTYEG